MDVSTLIGFILAIGLCVWGIGPSKLGNFVDMQSCKLPVPFTEGCTKAFRSTGQRKKVQYSQAGRSDG